jgi:hypothetical protein
MSTALHDLTTFSKSWVTVNSCFRQDLLSWAMLLACVTGSVNVTARSIPCPVLKDVLLPTIDMAVGLCRSCDAAHQAGDQCRASAEQVAVLFCWLIDNANNWGSDCSTTCVTDSSSGSSSSLAAAEDRLFEVYWTKLHPAGLDSDAELLAGLGVALEDVRRDEGRRQLLTRGTKVGSRDGQCGQLCCATSGSMFTKPLCNQAGWL